ncbi:MAG: YceI family protein [Kiritimatiellales bacterium]|nr:YceI family protein [Kiritimatiellales bacterium]
MRILFTILTSSAVFLSACSSSVITQEQRKLPPESSDNNIQERDEYTVPNVDYTQSFLAFTGSKGDLISHECAFEDFTLDITPDSEDPQNPEGAQAMVTINIASMVTDNDGLTKHLLSPDFFDVKTYPQAMFKTVSITHVSDDLYRVEADITIKNITKRSAFDMRMTDKYLTFIYDLDRTQFDVGPPAGGLKGIDAIVPIEAKIIFM